MPLASLPTYHLEFVAVGGKHITYITLHYITLHYITLHYITADNCNSTNSSLEKWIMNQL